MVASQEQSKAAHPAGKKLVPKVKILQRLLQVMGEHYWMYGAPTAETPNRVERWDTRSLLDYAVLTYEQGHYRPSYATFYHQRSTVMGLLMEMAEFTNWGEWRMWETDADRTGMDIERIVKRALDAEIARERS